MENALNGRHWYIKLLLYCVLDTSQISEASTDSDLVKSENRTDGVCTEDIQLGLESSEALEDPAQNFFTGPEQALEDAGKENQGIDGMFTGDGDKTGSADEVGMCLMEMTHVSLT